MCNIIMESNAVNALSKYLTNHYYGKKVAFVTQETCLKDNRNNLQSLKNLPLELNVYFMDEDARCNKLFSDILIDMIKNSDFVVCFGSGELVNIVKYVAYRLNIKYSILLNYALDGNYAFNYSIYFDSNNLANLLYCEQPECIYVDVDIILNTPKRYIASTFAYILGLNLSVLDMLYQNCDKNEIEVVTNLLKGINMFTSQNIAIKEGKIRLVKLMLELQLKLNSLKLHDTSIKFVGLYNKFYNCNKILKDGEVSLVFSMLVISLYFNVITNKLSYFPMDFNKRIIRLKTLFNDDDLITNAINNMSHIPVEKLNKLYYNKEIYQKYIALSFNRICNNINLLKQIYIDKGVIFNKIDINDFYKTLSLLGDVSDEKIIKVLNSIGVLDNI